MEIIVHRPTDPKKIAELDRRAAKMNALFALQYLEKLPYSSDEKRRIIDIAIQKLTEEMNKERETEEDIEER